MDRDAFTVGWVCALALELVASRMMLDHVYADAELEFSQAEANDTNSYTFGRIGGHNIVIVCLPAGVYGIPSAAAVAKEMMQGFSNIRFGVMVGIGDGFRTQANDIRLGDVVVSQPIGQYGGVVQYDLGKMFPGQVFQSRGSLNKPPRVLLGAVQQLRATHTMRGVLLGEKLQSGFQRHPLLKADFSMPESIDDGLRERDKQHNYSRPPRLDRNGNPDYRPQVHYGLIATGNSVIESTEERDRIQAIFSAPILCFEMEAAGLMDEFPCIVIRGISSLSVSDTGDVWQNYAAAIAAAYAKELLQVIRPRVVRKALGATKLKDAATKAAILELFSSDYQIQYNAIQTRPFVEGTCEWFFKNEIFLKWRDCKESSILWLTAGPGCGKSVLSQALIDKSHLNSTVGSHVCYFFFREGLAARKDGKDALSAILHQVFSGHDDRLVKLAIPAYQRHGAKLIDRLHEMWNLLIQCARRTTGYITCIIDALDECEHDARVELQSLLSSFYINRASESSREPTRLKFLITSRPYYDIHNHFRSIIDLGFCINLDGSEYANEIASDINLVIDREVPRMLQDLSDSTRQAVIQKFKAANSRTYLWFYLTLEIIARNPVGYVFKDDFDQLMNQLPSTIDEAYGKMLERAGHFPRARKILQLAIGARFALTLQEANFALAISEQPWPTAIESLQLMPSASVKRILENTCGLFIQVFDSQLHLIHQTAREYLMKPGGDPGHPWRGTISRREASGFFCQILVKYLLMKRAYDMLSHEDRNALRPLYQESSWSLFQHEDWTVHWRLSTPDMQDSMMDMVIMLLCKVTPVNRNHHDCMRAAALYLREQHKPFIFAAENHFDKLFVYMLKLAFNAVTSWQQTAGLVIRMVIHLSSHLSMEQSHTHAEALCECLESTPNRQRCLNFALELSLIMCAPHTIALFVEKGGSISIWSLRRAVAFHSWSVLEDATDLKVLLEYLQYQNYQTQDNTETDPYLTYGLLRPLAGEEHGTSRAEASSENDQSSQAPSHNSDVGAQFYSYEGKYQRKFKLSVRSKMPGSYEEGICILEDPGLIRVEIALWSGMNTEPLFPSHTEVAIEAAVENGWNPIVMWLLQPNSTPSSMDTMWSALSLAIQKNKKKIAYEIFEAYPNLKAVELVHRLEPIIVAGPNDVLIWLLELLPEISLISASILFGGALRQERLDLTQTILASVPMHRSAILSDALCDLVVPQSNEDTEGEEQKEPLEYREPLLLEKLKIITKLSSVYKVPIDVNDAFRHLYQLLPSEIFHVLVDSAEPLTLKVIAKECGSEHSYGSLFKAASTLQSIGANAEQLSGNGFEECLRQNISDSTVMIGMNSADSALLILNVMLRVALSGAATSLVDFMVSTRLVSLIPDRTLIDQTIISKDATLLAAIVEAGADPILVNAEVWASMQTSNNEAIDWKALQRKHLDSLGSDLCAVCYHGCIDHVSELLSHGSTHVNATSGFFGTALCAACYKGHYDIVVLLLAAGADINKPGREGSALRYALRDAAFDDIPEAYRVATETDDNSMVVQLLRNHMTIAASQAVEFMDERDFYDSDEMPDGDDEASGGTSDVEKANNSDKASGSVDSAILEDAMDDA